MSSRNAQKTQRRREVSLKVIEAAKVRMVTYKGVTKSAWEWFKSCSGQALIFSEFNLLDKAEVNLMSRSERKAILNPTVSRSEFVEYKHQMGSF
jgi:hypothetical protein